MHVSKISDPRNKSWGWKPWNFWYEVFFFFIFKIMYIEKGSGSIKPKLWIKFLLREQSPSLSIHISNSQDLFPIFTSDSTSDKKLNSPLGFSNTYCIQNHLCWTVILLNYIQEKMICFQLVINCSFLCSYINSHQQNG